MRLVGRIYLQSRYDVDKFLEEWVRKGALLRTYLMSSRAVIVGNAPLLFLQRSTRISAGYPLEFHMEMDGVFEFGSYVCSQGYTFLPSAREPSTFKQALLQCSTVIRTANSARSRTSMPSPILHTFKFCRAAASPISQDSARLAGIDTYIHIVVLRIPSIRHVLNASQSKFELSCKLQYLTTFYSGVHECDNAHGDDFSLSQGNARRQ